MRMELPRERDGAANKMEENERWNGVRVKRKRVKMKPEKDENEAETDENEVS